MPNEQALTRRAVLAAATAAPLLRSQPGAIDLSVVKRHDEAVERYLKIQVSDPADPHFGLIPDDFGLFTPGTAAGCISVYNAAFLHPGSKFHRDPRIRERLLLSIRRLRQDQNSEGNFDLLITNFNSPPDTAFIMLGVAAAAKLAIQHKDREVAGLLEPIIRKSGAALARGGIHTPNHRWVVCAALSRIHEVFPNAAYLRRIDQWLAEGIDIDEDGQYTERSTIGYNAIVDSAFVTLADKLRRPELLDPVRRNLDAMMYLMHADDEVVTEISDRQDQFQRGTMAPYWYSLHYLALKDGNGQYAALARKFAPERASLPLLMEYPELNQPLPAPAPLPDNYEKSFPSIGVERIRRGPASVTLLANSSRFLSLRHGGVVVNAVRFASAFFGKAQFIPGRIERRESGYRLEQSLEAAYYQPFDAPRRVFADHGAWSRSRGQRRASEVCRLQQSADVKEIAHGIQVRLRAEGTNGVPLAVEIGLREGGTLEGCIPAPRVADGWILAEGKATFRAEGNTIRFGPGLGAHRYTQVRGAEPKLPGTSVYLCGFTPFDHTLTFEW